MVITFLRNSATAPHISFSFSPLSLSSSVLVDGAKEKACDVFVPLTACGGAKGDFEVRINPSRTKFFDIDRPNY